MGYQPNRQTKKGFALTDCFPLNEGKCRFQRHVAVKGYNSQQFRPGEGGGLDMTLLASKAYPKDLKPFVGDNLTPYYKAKTGNLGNGQYSLNRIDIRKRPRYGSMEYHASSACFLET